MEIRPVYTINQTSVGVAYVLWALFGVFGIHRFYMGNPVYGLFLALTLGGFFILWILDFS